MTEDERDELLIRLDQGFSDFRKTSDEKSEIVERRLNSHSSDIKHLREWRNYLTGAWAAIAAGLGLHMKGSH